MSASQQQSEMRLNWLRWWHHGFWLQADSSWHSARFSSLTEQQQQRLLHQHATALHRTLLLPSALLPDPHPLILAMSDLQPGSRQLMLDLTAEICGCATPLPSEEKIWCRRLAKGLRPESWLPSSLFTGNPSGLSLQLLQALSPNIWPRLKLLFPQSMSTDLPELPAGVSAERLNTLWQATLWQSQQHQARKLAQASEKNEQTENSDEPDTSEVSEDHVEN